MPLTNDERAALAQKFAEIAAILAGAGEVTIESGNQPPPKPGGGGS